MVDFEVLKGTTDSSPLEQIKINFVLDILRKNFESYGFRPFDTPLIEFMDTLTLKYDDDAEIVNEIFKVRDRGERSLGLRYDLTTPLCRFMAQHKTLKKPFRRYHMAKVFRDGPIKKGRMREFIQCDGDVVGVKGQEIEAELLEMFHLSYLELGIKSIIELNNNKILRGAFLQVGFHKEDLSDLILSVDKLKKIGLDGVLEEVQAKNYSISKARDAIELLSCETLRELKGVGFHELLLEGINELQDLLDYLGDSIEYRLNFSMSRGLDIYTGNIWEAYSKDDLISSSLGSGGRYDKVIAEYINGGQLLEPNSDLLVPAVGVSFGLVPILACLQDELKDREGITQRVLCVMSSNKELVKSARSLASKFRLDGIKTELVYGIKLKKVFEYCDYLGARELVIFGEKDLEQHEVQIKNLDTKEVRVVKF